MAAKGRAPAPAGDPEDTRSWRERSVERSLQNARAKAVSRSERFIRAAEAIMLETGSSDFTVQELVERAKTSLRSFYQHFSNREELLLAVFEELLGGVADEIQRQIADSDDSLDGLLVLVRQTTGGAGKPKGQLLNRAFSSYHRKLAESNPSEYARILTPLYDIVLSVVRRGVKAGDFRTDLAPEAMALLMTQTLLAGGQMYALGAELGHGEISVDSVYEFFAAGLMGPRTGGAATTKRAAAAASPQRK